MHASTRAACALLLPLALGCSPRSSPPAPAPAAAASSDDPLRELSPEVRQIAREVEQVRGLRFRRPFTFVPVTDDELEAHFDEGKLESTRDASDPGALWAFGFLDRPPAPTWLTSLFARRGPRADGLLGFFVDETRRIYVRTRAATDPSIVAHELAHALAHDHLPISFDAKTDDRQLALRALNEGDATITAALVLGARKGRSPEATLRNASTWDASTRDFASATDATLGRSISLFRERAEVPYHAGAKFAARVVLARGMRGLDQVWQEPPRGMFEIFHPDLYAQGLPLPRIARPALPAACRVSIEGEMGELRTRAFLRQVHPRSVALAGAHGLLADRYHVLEDCGTSATTGGFVWQTAWLDEGTATQFEALVGQQLGGDAPGCLPGPHVVRRSGSTVVVVRGLTGDEVATAALAAVTPSTEPASPRLGGVRLERLVEETPHLVEGSSGKTCAIAATGVSMVAPAGLSLIAGKELACAMGSDTLDVSVTTHVSDAGYGKPFIEGLRTSLPSSLAAAHAQVTTRERYRVTPLGTGLSFVMGLTDPLRLEVAALPVCDGKRVLVLYLRSTSEEGRAMLEELLASLRPTSVGLSPACGDAIER